MKTYIVYAHDIQNPKITFQTYCDGMDEEDVRKRYMNYMNDFSISREIDKIVEKDSEM